MQTFSFQWKGRLQLLSTLLALAALISLPAYQWVAVGHPAWSAPKPLVVSFINIGQGDSALVETPSGKNILIDSGPPGGEDALFDYLSLRGIQKLDLIITSHPHQDHFGNTTEVIKRIKTKEVMDSGFVTGSKTQKELLKEIQKQNITFTNVAKKGLAGTSRNLGDGVTLRILQPKLPFLKGTNSDPNNNSVVVKLTMGSVSFLFTGDEEEKERKRLLNTNEDLKATFYKVAHHGSHNGTDSALLTRVAPKEAVISCALNNDYGHPHDKVKKLLNDAHIRTWRTDTQGTIKVVTNGATYDVVTLGP